MGGRSRGHIQHRQRIKLQHLFTELSIRYTMSPTNNLAHGWFHANYVFSKLETSPVRLIGSSNNNNNNNPLFQT